MFMGKRGQAAMEFLMTYGWAILVVLAAVGILAYLGVFDMEDRVPSRCELNPTGQGLDCQTDPYFDVEDEDEGTVTFTVINGNPGVVEVNSIEGDCGVLEDNDGNNIPFNMTRGETMVLTATCDDIAPGSNDLSFTIKYVDENGQPHSNRARISGVA